MNSEDQVRELVCFSQHRAPISSDVLNTHGAQAKLLQALVGKNLEAPFQGPLCHSSPVTWTRPLVFPSQGWPGPGDMSPDHAFYFLRASCAPRFGQGLGPSPCQASQGAGLGNLMGHRPDLRTRAECLIRRQMVQRMAGKCGLDPLAWRPYANVNTVRPQFSCLWDGDTALPASTP